MSEISTQNKPLSLPRAFPIFGEILTKKGENVYFHPSMGRSLLFFLPTLLCGFTLRATLSDHLGSALETIVARPYNTLALSQIPLL